MSTEIGSIATTQTLDVGVTSLTRMKIMSKHHYDGTKITIDIVRRKLDNGDYGSEVIDTIQFLIDQIDNLKEVE